MNYSGSGNSAPLDKRNTPPCKRTTGFPVRKSLGAQSMEEEVSEQRSHRRDGSCEVFAALGSSKDRKEPP